MNKLADIIDKYKTKELPLNQTINIIGRYESTIYRNCENGYTVFTMTTDNYNKIVCVGLIQNLDDSFHLVLDLKGTFKENDNKISFYFSEYKFCCYQKQDIISFLSSGIAKGLGIKKAEKIADKVLQLNIENILECFRDSYSLSTLSDKVPELKPFISEISGKMDKIFSFYDLFLFLVANGGNYHTALKLYKKYDSETMSVLKENVYKAGIGIGLEYALCDKIAKSLEYNSYDEKRIQGILYYSMQKVEDNNDCYCYLTRNDNIPYYEQTFEDLYNKIQNNNSLDYIPFELSAAWLIDNYYIGMEYDSKVDNYKIFSKKTYKQEYDTAKNIKRLVKSSVPMNFNPSYIEDIEKRLNIQYSKEQKESFNALKSTGIKVITGGPGTGKTTLIKGLIEIYKMIPGNENKIIKLCSPTGRASQKMSESTDMQGQTFHRWLEYKPYDDGVCSFSSDNYYDCDFVIFDEMSMAGLNICNLAFDALKNGTLVILVGDIDQLPSVENGNVFEDIISSGICEVYRLKTVFRQSNGENKISPIIENALKINNDDNNLMVDSSFEYIKTNDEVSVLSSIEDYVSKGYQVLCPCLGSLLGSNVINEYIQCGLFRYCEEDKSIGFGNTVFHLDDKVIAIHNNYKKNYFNGEIGVVTDIDNKGMEVTFTTGKVIYVKGSYLGEFLPAYAITIHKAQGSEFDNVVIVLSDSAKSLLTKKILYTAITRAKKKVVLIDLKNSMQECLSSVSNMKKRHTNLQNMLIAA